ncbi:putative movement protein [Allium polerovirus A]|uniref:Movement protein n=1 Tax=Allium polerovirus A TaxID=2593979 RepID=A0AAE9T3F9_9VIRU|nr:putative movement protein [Allium polerovirus A]
MQDDVLAVTNGVQQCNSWLFQRPLGVHNADEDDEEEAEIGDEMVEFPELQATGRHSYFQKTVSREVPPDQSRSGRLYQSARLSQLEFSAPTMNIRSQWCRWNSSPRPLQRQQAPSLTSWMHTASPLRLLAQSTNSASPKRGHDARFLLEPSMESPGTPQMRTNSDSSTRGTVKVRLPGRSK